ncbi:GntR family transcriptional regulator [Streptomyces physcomitrii]|uniref:GntR family transcriptional regulator n=1 Tax=Streptomyces physcomitrii TaxID=2724184 RepID=A0ABX1HA82_9ACTN|nr:GntR family transcriptional regulator [Streptomyces physcomitrii]NKI45312.1 GntR family transcriptional regulator [Streptomyces physcomitrii]
MDTGLYTQVDTDRDPPGPAPREPLLPHRDRVYALLREELLGGRIGPRERLGEVRLAGRYGVSRTPVREALAWLRADGLIERGDGGYFPVVPNLAQLRDLYELRVTLELRGVARALEDPSVRHDPVLLGAELERWYALRAAPPRPDPQFVVLDEEFHTALSRASGNPALTEALTAVNRKIRRVRMYDFLTQERVDTTITEHIEIMELVRGGRLDEGHRALHEHVGASMDVVLEHARRALTQMALHTGQA